MVRHIERKHGGVGTPVNGKSYSIKQPASEVFLRGNKLSALYGKQPSNDRELEESDMVDTIYDKVKKAKARQDKIKEMKRFFSELSNSIISLPSPLTLARRE